jgi:hypothetical protein
MTAPGTGAAAEVTARDGGVPAPPPRRITVARTTSRAVVVRSAVLPIATGTPRPAPAARPTCG